MSRSLFGPVFVPESAASFAAITSSYSVSGSGRAGLGGQVSLSGILTL